ncbi:alpha 1,2 mannosyltransferase [Savitreella phatthalungensis]
MALRFALALFSPSYLHPDEWLQGPQPAYAILRQRNAALTWEFSGEQPVRSILPILLFNGPLLALVPGSPTWLLYATRVQAWLVSCVVAALLPEACGLWPMLTFLVRPFSNTAETLLVLSVERLSRSRGSVLLGALIGLGLFTRISFAAWIAPLGVRLLRRGVSFGDAFRTVAGALSTILLSVLTDYLYYGRLTLTPLNNLMYNSDSGNLSQHGLHPHYLHMLNLLILLGPLALQSWSLADARVQGALLGTLILSLAPHQEMRFLLPGWALLVSASRLRKSRFMLPYTVALVLFYGFLHQSQVITTATRLATICGNGTATWIKSYPAPGMLLGDCDVVHLYGDAATATTFPTDYVVAPRSLGLPFREVSSSLFYFNLDDPGWPAGLSIYDKREHGK